MNSDPDRSNGRANGGEVSDTARRKTDRSVTDSDLLGTLAAEAAKLDRPVEEYIVDILRGRRRIEDARREIETNHQVLVDAHREIDALRADSSTKTASIEDLRSERTAERNRRKRFESEVSSLRERLETRERRIERLEGDLATHSRLDERVDELSLVVREDRVSKNVPFFVRWWQWYRADSRE